MQEFAFYYLGARASSARAGASPARRRRSVRGVVGVEGARTGPEPVWEGEAQMDAWGYAAYDVAELSYSGSAEARRRPGHAPLLQMDWIFVRVGSALWERARKAPL